MKSLFFSKRIITCIIIFLAGALVGTATAFLLTQKAADADSTVPLRKKSGNLVFTSPLLAVGDLKRFRDYKILETDIGRLIEERVAAKKAEKVSVYFRDLLRGRWMSVNEDLYFNPASMLKVSILIAYFKSAESNPALLKDFIVYEGNDHLDIGNESNSSPEPIIKGKEYSIEDLLTRMIVYSDNNAKNLLFAALNKNSIKDVFTDLAFPESFDTTDNTMSAKNLSLFFRVLFNSTYLNENFSEEALRILSQTKFKDGLVGGVPNKIMVSHKFGHALVNDQGTVKSELHDCGIVYYPNHPYLLCVMTKGKDPIELESVIQDISAEVYMEREKEFGN